MMSMNMSRSFVQPQDTNMSMTSVRSCTSSSGFKRMSKEEKAVRTLKTQTQEKLIAILEAA